MVLHLTACIAKLQNITSLLCLYVTAEPFPEVSLNLKLLNIYLTLVYILKCKIMLFYDI